ncbi:hypothetical protein [Actinomadura rupiterrae]|uniref:hypothetical protein n=1 Tax=Actinomadura rupiterrae TaxID=559627 RepID=UPI0020A253F6|nr:hypothetical protein [Actinomadura rupiterrae]MCP2340224.1 hypothetical protein [Actinomadura rupiterrae]
MSEAASAMDASTTERRIAYRSPQPWLGLAGWTGFVIVVVAIDAWTHRKIPVLWAGGSVLMDVAAALTIIRGRRGFTLSPAGISWRRHDAFFPWSNVAEVCERTVGRRSYVVVRLADPDQVNDLPRGAVGAARRNVQKYGGPFAAQARWLDIPAAEFVAEAERFRAAYRSEFLSRHAAPSKDRVAELVWWVGVVLLVLGFVPGVGSIRLGHAAETTQNKGPLEFRYQARGGTGYMDQTLAIANRGGDAIAPTLVFTPQDEQGHDLPQVRVRTALGSDGGLVVVPPQSTAFDVLAFSGPSAGSVRKVKVTVVDRVKVDAPMLSSEGLRAEPLDAQGRLVQLGSRFAKVRVTPRSSSQLAAIDTGKVRVVCIAWGPETAGAPQQMVDRVAVTDLAPLDRGAPTEVAVTGPGRDHTEQCGSLVAYYSRG